MIADPVREGLARGWRVTDAARLQEDAVWRADVVIAGSGAGGAIAAHVLSSAGLEVIVLEEGGLYSSSDFTLREAEAYPALYQDAAARQTRDHAITILQGRAVGGSTLVNWTTSFRTPETTLAYWHDRLGLPLDPGGMVPWFERAEALVGVSDWLADPNPNNAVLARGCEALGIPHARIRRNVRGCWNLGYCGMGCPTNAKQSMLLTALPAALERGARLVHRARVEAVEWQGRRASGVRVAALGPDGVTPTGRTLHIRADQVVLAGGAINTPALLLKSRVPDAGGRIGRATCLHPTLVSGAVFATPVRPFEGAPQSVYSDHFLHLDPVDGRPGFKLEAPPVHPLLAAVTLTGFGDRHAGLMADLPRLNVLIALVRDGFHPDLAGGTVSVKAGRPQLDYPLTPVFWQAARRALLAMADIQFAAGARQVLPLDERLAPLKSMTACRKALDGLDLRALSTRVVSAHVMGGCAMGTGPRQGAVNPDGRLWGLDNVTVCDGSLFPTSIGANPQVSVYAQAWRVADGLARSLGKTPSV
ncbi:GMC family oxidoreductase [Laribacter hongkongensis]|uniref:GMC family oxidoreductase n=1 Tax=Laribacter hongkongensis TaxID=168471 RepID=UPI001EFECA8E|nr:GMC family oxidoreductase [Laribacter hongkongensis]MCG9066108.1 GMC family oxidoreductase [Laribacter hongkongensis]